MPQSMPFSRNNDGKSQRRVLREDVDAIYEFLQSGIHALEELGEVYISEKMKKVQILNTPAFSMGISLKSGLLDLTLDSSELSMDELAEVLTKYNRQQEILSSSFRCISEYAGYKAGESGRAGGWSAIDGKTDQKRRDTDSTVSRTVSG